MKTEREKNYISVWIQKKSVGKTSKTSLFSLMCTHKQGKYWEKAIFELYEGHKFIIENFV